MLFVLFAALITSPATALDKYIYQPTVLAVTEPDFVTAFEQDGLDVATLEAIVDTEINVMLAAGVTGIYAGFPHGGARRDRFHRALQRVMNAGIEVYLPLNHPAQFDEYNATGSHSHLQPLPFTGYILPDEPIGRRSSFEVAFLAKMAKDSGRPTIENFGGNTWTSYDTYLTQYHSTLGGRLIDYLDVVSVDDYGSRGNSSAFREMAYLAGAYGKEFRAVLGNSKNASVNDLTGQVNQAIQLGAPSVAFWTMDGQDPEDPTRFTHAYTSCDPYPGSGYHFLSGDPYVKLEVYDYGDLVFEACFDDPDPFGYVTNYSGPDEVFVEHWGFAYRSLAKARPTVWNWFAGI